MSLHLVGEHVEIIKGNAVLRDPSDEAVSIISSCLSVIDPKARFRGAFANPIVKFYSERKGDIVFPKMLLTRVKREFIKHGSRLVSDPGRVCRLCRQNTVHGQLDEMQERAVDVLLAVERGVVELSVGSGKTIVMAELAGSYFHHVGKPVIVLVPKRQLLMQTHAELSKFLPHLTVGMVGDGHRKYGDVTVVTDRTGGSVLLDEDTIQFFNTCGAIILDECHHIVSPTWGKFVDTYAKDRVWALSGKVTFKANRIEELRIERVLGPPLLKARNEARLCPVEVHFHDEVSKGWKKSGHPILKESNTVAWYMPKGGTEWQKAVYLQDSVEGTGVYIRGRKVDTNGVVLYETAEDMGTILWGDRNRWAANLVKEIIPTGKVVLAVSRTIHLLVISNLLRKYGVEHKVVSGKLSGKEQQLVFSELEAGSIRVVVSQYSCLKEGTNIPSLTDIIILNGTVGEQVLEQLKGRVERKSPGKEKGTVHIPGDFHNKHLRKKVRSARKYYVAAGVLCKSVPPYSNELPLFR